MLHRLRARPGSRLIEAGAGSGSFTHASVRAVYNGVSGRGKTFSFEFHEDRAKALRSEIKQHGLDGLVRVVGRDVCNDGFVAEGGEEEDEEDEEDVKGIGSTGDKVTERIDASAVFLDLPAPWLAIPQLTRYSSTNTRGPLSPNLPVHVCCFSPCLEQSLRTIAVMRDYMYTDIDLVEVAHKKIEVRRVGAHARELKKEGVEISEPASIEESIRKLHEVLVHRKMAHDKQIGIYSENKKSQDASEESEQDEKTSLFHQGRVVTKTESELKTHTSYLVFAILPIEWSEEAEAALTAKYPVGNREETKIPDGKKRNAMGGKLPMPGSNRSIKKEAKRRKMEEEAVAQGATNGVQKDDGDEDMTVMPTTEVME